MTSTTVFTELLKTFADYSERLDNGEVTHSDFGEFQQIHPRITRGYQTGRFNTAQYRALNFIYYDLKEGFRTVLQLDRVYDLLTEPGAGADPGELPADLDEPIEE